MSPDRADEAEGRGAENFCLSAHRDQGAASAEPSVPYATNREAEVMSNDDALSVLLQRSRRGQMGGEATGLMSAGVTRS